MKKYLPMCIKTEYELKEALKLFDQIGYCPDEKSFRALRNMKIRLEHLLKDMETVLG